MRVLGVDPGLGVTGYAVIDLDGPTPSIVEAGAIRPRRRNDMAARLRSVYEDVHEVLREFQPQLLGLESLYSEYRFPRSALQMAHVRGVICLAAANVGIAVIDIAPREVKNALIGAGNATKEQIQRSVQDLFGLPSPPRPADVADAIAIATAVAYRSLRA